MAIDVDKLSFAGFDLHKWAPGFESGIKGKWAEHMLIGRAGALQEDQGDGVLTTSITLEFPGDRAHGKTARDQWNDLQRVLAKTRRGTLVHPLRGSRYSILEEVKESMRWVDRGNVITVQLSFKDAALDITLPSDAANSASMEVREHADVATQGASLQQARVFMRSNVNLAARRNALEAVARVGAWAAAAREYATLAIEAQSGGIFQVGDIIFAAPAATPAGALIGSAIRRQLRQVASLRQRLRTLPSLMQAASESVRASGSLADVQRTINAMELGLAAATRIDTAIQETLPVPIRFTVESPLSIYQIVQERYAGTDKTPQQLRALVQVVLAMNPQLRSPERVPAGTSLARPSL